MRVEEPIGIVAATTWIPEPRYPASMAVPDGDPRGEFPRWEGYEEFGVCEGSPLESMAVPAACRLLGEQTCEAGELGLILYASVFDAGSETAAPNARNDGIMPQTRLARLIGADRAMAIGIGQVCTGGAGALEVCIAMMLTEPRYGRALVVTADCFTGWQGGARWSNSGTGLLGDGAAALLLRRGDGPLAVRSIASSSACGMEELSRFCAKDIDDPAILPGVIARVTGDASRCVNEAVTAALAEAAIEPSDPRIAAVTLPRLGHSPKKALFDPGLPAGLPEPLFLDANTGHLGAGDQLANVSDVMNKDLLRPGQYAVMISGGGAFTASCMVVERRNQ